MNKYYWFVMLDSFKDLPEILGLVLVIFGGVASAVVTICHFEGEMDDDKWKTLRKLWAIPAVGLAILIVLMFIPTTKQLAAIILLPKIVENKQIADMPENVARLANEWIEELRPKKEK